MFILPAILEEDKNNLLLKIHELTKYFTHIHMDLVTNHYKDLQGTLTIDDIIDSVKRFPNVKFDIHIMAPQYDGKLINDDTVTYFNKIFIHIESKIEVDVRSYPNIIYAFDLYTNIFDYAPIIKSVDEILIMSVPSGKQGQKFNIITYEKIRKITSINPEIQIYIDGGIDKDISKKLESYKNVKGIIVGSHISDFINKT
ncbi:MAG: hypothetical protein N3A71_00255 [Candidatus Dojkabacteria bacterium]|nr:hypothetical protein [Candidatus Dojkabacteria bacterium]